MQGIAGVVYPDVFQVSRAIFPMLEILKHRGIYPKETETFKNVELGITGGRLGTNRKRSIIATLDGSVLNAKELQAELQKENLTDADLFVAAYEKWGQDCFQKISGDFACVILDKRKESLFLVRDRIGKKPLYWFHDGRNFLFASELKSLLISGLVPQTISDEAIANYLYFGYIPQNHTPIKKVQKLLPGYYLIFQLNQMKRLHQYWSLSSYYEKGFEGNPKEIPSLLDEKLKESVKTHITQDKNVGCFLSGGIGSSSIAYYLSQNLKSFSGYTVTFQEINDEDLDSAKQVVETLQIRHRYERISKELFIKDLIPISWHLDEPVADPTTLITWKLVEMAKKQCHTLYSGMGCDELLAGHARYTIEEEGHSLSGNLLSFFSPLFRQVIVPLLNPFFPDFSFNLLRRIQTNPRQLLFFDQNALLTEDEIKVASPHLAKYFDAEVLLHQFINLSRIPSTTSSLAYLDIKTKLVDYFCHQYERITAAHGMKWVAPYLDRPLIEFIASLPEPEKLEVKETASYLKTILKPIFPKSVLERPKITRKEFLKPWLIQEPFLTFFQKLQQGTLVETGLISATWLQQEIEDLSKPNTQSFKHLWAILVLEIWFRLYLNQPVTKEAPDITLEDLFES